MFNKTRGEQPQPSNQSQRSQPADLSAPGTDRVDSKPNRTASGRPATLGPSISISGNLSGNEDLVIEGSVEGEVIVKDHMVTISQSGRVKADVYGRSICVEGEVNGNLVGDEQVIIRQSGRVRGNVTAPRVNLENGAKFKGSIDMQPIEAAKAPQAKAGAAETPSSRIPEPRASNVAATAAAARVPKVAGETA